MTYTECITVLYADYRILPFVSLRYESVFRMFVPGMLPIYFEQDKKHFSGWCTLLKP